ncbi:MAG: hypothetical protein NZ992_03570 [Candidatus Korarchaeum sp.]|nr:hypothetical protein [Candidatus Korarchaeum sp.]MDW8035614.1 hypothetical protein [Candidatus Korarchaeum sp.]
MLSGRSWRRRVPAARRRRRVISPSIKATLEEAIYGALLAIFTFPISLFIAELGVWVMIVWMQPIDVIVSNFYLTLVLIQTLFLLIPAYNKQPIRLIFATLVAYVIWTTLVSIASFDPVTTLFGKLPY